LRKNTGERKQELPPGSCFYPVKNNLPDFYTNPAGLNVPFFPLTGNRWYSCSRSVNPPENSLVPGKPIFIFHFQPINPKDYL
jgi:hypothetical protein